MFHICMHNYVLISMFVSCILFHATKWTRYYRKETRTNHQKGITQEIISLNHYNKSMDNLHNNKIPASRSHNFYIEPVPKGYITEYWAEILVFKNTSLPITSKISK